MKLLPDGRYFTLMNPVSHCILRQNLNVLSYLFFFTFPIVTIVLFLETGLFSSTGYRIKKEIPFLLYLAGLVSKP
jgi:hypothetical protein